MASARALSWPVLLPCRSGLPRAACLARKQGGNALRFAESHSGGSL